MPQCKLDLAPHLGQLPRGRVCPCTCQIRTRTLGALVSRLPGIHDHSWRLAPHARNVLTLVLPSNPRRAGEKSLQRPERWHGLERDTAAGPGYGPMGHSRHPNRIVAIAQLDLDHGDCHWAVAKWSIGIGQPLWRRAMMAAARRPDAGVPLQPRPAPDAHASLLKLPPRQIIFCAATPAPGLRPLTG